MKRLLLATSLLLWGLAGRGFAQEPSMTAHFIDVGQAHATLLEFPCGAMLIDAGADEDHEHLLETYLTAFFERRSDLHRTLDVVLITHNHIDHTRALRGVVEAFSVKRFFDNGFTQGSGVGNPNWLKREKAAGRRDLLVRDIDQRQVDRVLGRSGLTDNDIDPFDCGSVDPRVRVLTGRIAKNPGWPEADYDNQNNHSLVTRIDFGQASFLFMGDLEEAGIESLIGFYGHGPGGVLNVDILQVGHHGSHNATTSDLLSAVTPYVAVIPVGQWTFGQGSQSPFTTFAYGHPRQDVVDSLSTYISRHRPRPRPVMVAERSRQFHTYTVTKAVYATAWDGTIRVIATPQGTFRVYRER